MSENSGRKWLWRSAIAFVLLIVVPLIAHVVWTIRSVRAVEERVAALRSAGEPVLPADFEPPPDGPDNGVSDLEQAIEMADVYEPGQGEPFDLMSLALPLRPEERAAIADAVAALAPADAAVDLAATKPRIDWKLNLATPVLTNLNLHSGKGLRRIVRFQTAAALLEHEQGKDAHVMRRVERAMFLARSGGKFPSIVGNLVSVGLAAMASDAVMEIAPDLRVGTGEGDASTADVRRVIDLLLDDAPSREAFVRAVRGERMAELDAVRNVADGTFPSANGSVPGLGIRGHLMRPIRYRDIRFALEYTTAIQVLADAENLPQARARMPARPPDSKANLFSNLMVPSLSRFPETHFRGMTDRRLAATALALRWYATEHDGKLPPTLDALVPRYLPAVPIDPLASDRRRFGYAPDQAQPSIWSVGADARDDGGRDVFTKPRDAGREPNRGDEWNTLDRIVYLIRRPRPAPEPTEESPTEPTTQGLEPPP